MSITNQTKPTTSVTNSTRIATGETWNSNTSTWTAETRTWIEMGSKISTSDKPKLLGAYTFDEIGTRTIEDTGGQLRDSSFMNNEAKPT